jgi:pre-mRNA-splicing factor 38B
MVSDEIHSISYIKYYIIELNHYHSFSCDRFENYLEEEEEFTPSSDPELTMTMGSYCIKLLTDMQYFGTTLPRIPVPIERKIKVMLLLLNEKQKRRKGNLKDVERFVKGAKVRAIYSDEENEPAWYDAVIDNLEDGKYWVTFPEYGNQSLVDLGEMELIETSRDRRRSRSKERHRGRDRSRSHDRDRRDGRKDRHRSRSRSRSRSSERRRRSRDRDRDRDRDSSSEDLLQKVLREQRDSSAAVGKDYARRIAGYKQSLALKADTFTARRRSRSRSPRNRGRERDRERDRGRDSDSRARGGGAGAAEESSFTKPSTKSTEMSQQQLENIRKLKERYGDASSSAT